MCTTKHGFFLLARFKQKLKKKKKTFCYSAWFVEFLFLDFGNLLEIKIRFWLWIIIIFLMEEQDTFVKFSDWLNTKTHKTLELCLGQSTCSLTSSFVNLFSLLSFSCAVNLSFQLAKNTNEISIPSFKM